MVCVKKLQSEFRNVQSYAQKNLSHIRDILEKQIVFKKFLITDGTWAGKYHPDYLTPKLTRGFKRGKIFDEKPNQDCVLVYLDSKETILYMLTKSNNPKFNHESYYRVEYNGYLYFLYKFDDNFADWGASYRAKYNPDGTLVEWIQLGLTIIQNEYYHSNGQVLCKNCYINPLNSLYDSYSEYTFELDNGKVRNLIKVN